MALRILNDYIPESNFTNANGSPGYQANVPLPVNTDEILVKFDHQLNDAHRLSPPPTLQTGEIRPSFRVAATFLGRHKISNGGRFQREFE